MARDVFIVLDAEDPSRARVKSFTDDSSADPITIYRSDNDTWRHHWLKKNPNPTQGRPFIYGTRPNSFKVGAGIVDAKPTAGTYTITGPSGGTSAALAYNAAASVIQTALRTDLTAGGNIVVTLLAEGLYEIDWGTTGALGNITANTDGLVPSGSSIEIVNTQNGTLLVNEKWQIKLKKALPFLYTSGSVAFASPSVSADIAQAGSPTANKIYSLTWNSDAVGGTVSFAVSTTGSNIQTVGPIPYNATAEELVTYFDKHTAIASTDLSATQVGPGSYTVMFIGTLDLDNAPTIATADNDLVVPVGDECDIVMETGGADAILLGETSADITYELEVFHASGKNRTFAEPATLQADLISNTGGSTQGQIFVSEADLMNYSTAVDETLIKLTSSYSGAAANPLFEINFSDTAWISSNFCVFKDDGAAVMFSVSGAGKIYGVSLEIASTAAFGLPITTKTATYTATIADHTILCDATAGAFDIDLPAASTRTGQVYVIKKIDSGANVVSIDPNGTEEIDNDGAGVAVQLTTESYAVTIQSTGTKWVILSAYSP